MSQENNFPFEIFCGEKITMDRIAQRGAKALNTKTMRYQIVCKTAKYKVIKQENSDISYSLFSDVDIRKLAKQKGFII